jgi:hypothetical protein
LRRHCADSESQHHGETEYLHGVIEFYQTVLSVKSTLLGQAQNEKVRQLTEASKKISAWAAIFFAPTLIGTPMLLLSVGLYLTFRRRKWLQKLKSLPGQR